MSRYHLRPILAVTDDGRMPFNLTEPALTGLPFGQEIVAAYAWPERLYVDANRLHEALGVLFREANVGEDGWARRYRDGRQRSLSVGDLVEIGGETAPILSYWQVLTVGFGMVDRQEVARVLVEEPWSFRHVDRQREQYETEGGR